MTAKEYLAQMQWLEKMIFVKLERVDYLRSIAEKASAVLSKTPPSGSRNPNRMEDIIVAMVDMEDEVTSELASLLKLQRNIKTAIDNVPNHEQKMLLELRYLSTAPWHKIAATMCYNKNYIHEIHLAALSEIKIPQEQ